MSDEQHVEDLRNVEEGDRVTLETNEEHAFDAECVSRETERADPRTGEIREIKTWEFDIHGSRVFATITDGLAGHTGEIGQFPEHSALWDSDAEENLGYITGLHIHGKVEN